MWIVMTFYISIGSVQKKRKTRGREISATMSRAILQVIILDLLHFDLTDELILRRFLKGDKPQSLKSFFIEKKREKS